MGKTSSAVKDRYNAKAYDEIKVRVDKGQKEIIKAHATVRGESVNGFINRAVSETMNRDNSQDVPSGSFESDFSLEALQAAQKAAAATGETVIQFIERAVITQDKRDGVVLKMGGKPTVEK